ncbi:hypothetical protein RRG08_038245 [Elysia crispata]|uniref:Uncharacterized protein n=1 Tax=Elysia crispata TaxID=231223 RepID=A0AAE1E1F2_9GAST|nr:hypothetical protein RRG08_038245 [Elysia crispata]
MTIVMLREDVRTAINWSWPRPPHALTVVIVPITQRVHHRGVGSRTFNHANFKTSSAVCPAAPSSSGYHTEKRDAKLHALTTAFTTPDIPQG